MWAHSIPLENKYCGREWHEDSERKREWNEERKASLFWWHPIYKLYKGEKREKISAKNFLLPLMRRMVLLINVRWMRNDATFHRARYLVAFEPANRKNRTTVRWRKIVKKYRKKRIFVLNSLGKMRNFSI